MSRVVFVGKRHDKLIPLMMKLVPDAIAATNFKFELQAGDVLCWLPMANEAVDDKALELAALLDRTLFSPTKIVMLSIAGTADDATLAQLKQWYGPQAEQLLWAHQYAVKMIDEFELPYTIVRTLPIVSQKIAGEIIAEGTHLQGKHNGIDHVAQVIKRVVMTSDFDNQSIGIKPQESEE